MNDTSAVIWLSLALTGVLYEAYTLARGDDEHQPLTYHLRRIGRHTWLRVGLVAFWVWLPLHLLGVVP